MLKNPYNNFFYIARKT